MPTTFPTNSNLATTWIVNPTAGKGSHTTIATALTSASSGDTILITPGTYTENLTLKVGVDLCAYDCDALTPNVSIVGKCTMTTAGTCSISGIRLTTNSDFFLAVTGSAASKVNLIDCYFNCSNNTGISFTSSDSGSQIYMKGCINTFGTTGITLWVSTASGLILIDYCDFFYGSATSTASSNSAAQVVIKHSNLNFPVSCSSTGVLDIVFTTIATNNQNATCITTAGSGSSTITLSTLSSGSASSASIGSGSTLYVLDTTVKSTNTNAITGLGTIFYGPIVFTDSSSIINTTTQTALYTNLAKYKASAQPSFFAYLANAQSNVTGDGTVASVPFDTEDFDVGSNFASNTFTAPVAGKYYLYAQVLAQQVAATMTAEINMIVSGNNYRNGNWGTTVTGNMPQTVSTIVNMAAGDTATVTITYTGGTKVVDIYGASGDRRTYFTGYQLG